MLGFAYATPNLQPIITYDTNPYWFMSLILGGLKMTLLGTEYTEEEFRRDERSFEPLRTYDTDQ